jgi:type II secretory pathway pseudopilin PulG
MVALLVGMNIMAVLMAAALPVWTHAAQREREEELIWRGEQYKRAITLFQRKYANAFPPTIDVLVEQRFLRQKYKDPITGEDFQLIPVGGIGAGIPGGPGVQGPGTPGQAGQPFGGQSAATLQFGAGGGAGAPGSQLGSAGVPGQNAPGGAQLSFAGGQTAGRGIQGVTSKSAETSIKLYNGMNKYNQWAFVALATATQAGQGAAGFARPGQGSTPGAFAPGGFGSPNPGGFGPAPGGFGAPGAPGSGFGQPLGPVPPGFGTPGMPPPPPGGGSVFRPVNPGGLGGPTRPPVGPGFPNRPPQL